MIEIGKLYKYNVLEKTIPIEAFKEAFKKTPEARDYICSVDYQDNLSPWSRWVVFKGKYRGAWTKRFQAFVYDTYRVKLKPEELSVIGSELSNHSIESKGYFFEINKPIWDSPTFGDVDSCWYTPERDYYKRTMLADLRNSKHGYAVKFFESEEKFIENPLAGIGRCWCYLPNTNPEIMLLYNGRGAIEKSYYKILALTLGFKYQSVQIELKGGYTDENDWILGTGELPSKYTIDYGKEE